MINKLKDKNHFEVKRLTELELNNNFRNLASKFLPLNIPIYKNLKFINKKELILSNSFLAWGVSTLGVDKESIGLLIAQPFLNPKEYSRKFDELSLNIISIKVKGLWKRKGVATLLMESCMNWSQNIGFTSIVFPAAISQKNTFILNKLTPRNKGWQYIPGEIIVTLSDRKKVEPLLNRFEKISRRLKKTYKWETYPYPKELNNELNERILNAKDNLNIGIPYDKNDDSYSWKPSYEYSKILVANNKIIGWIICELISPRILIYRKLWVDPGWERKGCFIGMLSEIMLKAHFAKEKDKETSNKSCPINSGIFINRPNNLKLLRFTEKHFKPICDSWVPMSKRYLNLKRSI